MKLQPRTRGDYVFKITPPAAAKICRLELLHIGDNMPCTEPPPIIPTGYENTLLQYAAGVALDANECGEDASYTFKVG
jgi:hypothetical protein